MKFDEYYISDLVEVTSSKRVYAKDYSSYGIPFYRSKEIILLSKGYNIKDSLYITKEKYENIEKNSIPKEGDILLTSVGTIGVPLLILKSHLPFYFKDGNLIRFHNFKSLLINKYLFYWLKSPIGKHEINKITIGSTQKALTMVQIKKIPIKIPNISCQNRIVSILSSLDSKIEVNNQIISNLEELASTLFKRWFVDFEFPDENGNPYKSSGGKMVDSELGKIPEGWELRTLGYFSEIIMGQSPKGESYNNDNSGLPLLNGASDFKNGIISPLKYTTEPKKVTQKGDFIFGVRATVGHVTESDGIYAIGRGTGLARTKNYYAKEFLYFSLKNIIRYLELTASGSVYVNISKKELNDFKLIYPANRILQLFHRSTVNLFKEKMNKYIENQFLTELRDSLLPKLLSGEIELPEDEEM